jgi:hypothetical protein
MKASVKTLIWLTIFSIAMGYLESSVVVYLRDLYYPQGFNFPLKTIDHGNALTEFWREVATIIMLYSAGWLAGNSKAQRFAYFIYSFAIWDIFYYVFLKALINWPETLFTWDILFLIPVPWVGPVLAPCLVDIAFVLLALSILYISEKGLSASLSGKEKVMLSMGCLVIVFSFIKDYLENLSQNHDFNVWTPISQKQLFADFMTYVPASYSWWLFSLGELCLVFSTIMYWRRNITIKGKQELQNIN